jgi:hypothetical protein
MHIAPGLSERVALIALQAVMAAFATKLWGNPNGIKGSPPSAVMSSRMGQAIRRADMDPPALFANSHPSLMLMDHVRLDQSGFEVAFSLSQRLVAPVDKGSNAACPEVDAKPLLRASGSHGHREHFDLPLDRSPGSGCSSHTEPPPSRQPERWLVSDESTWDMAFLPPDVR